VFPLFLIYLHLFLLLLSLRESHHSHLLAPAAKVTYDVLLAKLQQEQQPGLLSFPRKRWLLLFTLVRNPRLVRARRTGKEGKTLDSDSRQAGADV
jgi:hypothetical protein